MKHQLEKQKKENSGKLLPMAGLVLGIIATAFVRIWLTQFVAASTSRLSIPSEIADKKNFMTNGIQYKKNISKKLMLQQQKQNKNRTQLENR